MMAGRRGISRNIIACLSAGMEKPEGRAENTVERGDNSRVMSLRTTRGAGEDPGPIWSGCPRGGLTVGSL